MSTSSANNFSAPLSTIDDSAPISGWLTLGQHLPRPFGPFIRHGRWRIGWLDRPQPNVLEPIGEVAEPAHENSLPAVIVPKSVAIPLRSFTLPPIFADSLSFLLSALLHASFVIALAWWTTATPISPRIEVLEGSFVTVADEIPELAVSFDAPQLTPRWEVLTSTLDDFTPSRRAISAVEQAAAVVNGPELPARSTGPVSDIRTMTGRASPAELFGNPTPGVDFFGITAHGKRFVFIVDCSASMAGDKWSLAKEELLRSLAQLGADREFYVILYDGGPHPMFNDRRPAETPLPATEENIQRVREWLATVALGFNTSPCLAVKHGLDLEPSVMFLLTDGEFNDPTTSYLRENNRVTLANKSKAPRIIVNTVSFGAPGQRLLVRIAQENGGEFRKVSP